MFRPTPMRKVNIFILERDVEDVTVALARLEALHLTETEGLEDWATEATGRWAGLADTYSTQERRLANLLDVLDVPRREASQAERLDPRDDAPRIEEALNDAEDTVEDWQDRQEAVEREIEQLRLLLREVRLLTPLDIPVEGLRELRYLFLTVGTMPSENLAGLQIALFRIPFVIIPAYEYDDRILIFAASAKEHAPILDRALRSAFMEPLELPEELSGAPEEVVEALEERLEDAQRRQADLEEERERLIEDWGSRLLALWHQARSNASISETVRQLGRHGDVYLMTGWVPRHLVDAVIDTIQDVTEGRADAQVLELPARRQREAPTLLQNPAFLKPFEYVVSTFGFPAYDEVDPTPFVALTFVLMYGMMFGDVGHGLLLALGGLWLWQRSEGSASLGPLLAAAGVSGAVFGLLYGSLFGLEGILPHLWLSPLEDILDISVAAVAAGVVLINVGFLLHLVSAWWSRDWAVLLFDSNGMAGAWLYWSLLGGGLAIWQGISFPTSLWLLLILAPAALIFLHEPLDHLLRDERPLVEGSWGEYGVESFFEVFEALISYVSNSLSFVRLGAFAVAHAGLSQVVFILADMSGGIGRWLVIALGTVIIVGFEGLIVGIQTLRLEYYEFFGKFFRGAGLRFTPLRLPEVE